MRLFKLIFKSKDYALIISGHDVLFLRVNTGQVYPQGEPGWKGT